MAIKNDEEENSIRLSRQRPEPNLETSIYQQVERLNLRKQS
jgi:hypothetical protein